MAYKITDFNCFHCYTRKCNVLLRQFVTIVIAATIVIINISSVSSDSNINSTMDSVNKIDLGNGVHIPVLGYGTWQAGDSKLEAALDMALQAGYRHIDTAYVYENEAVIGKVLKKWISDGKLKREDLFIVTKLPPVGNRPSSVEKYLKKSLASLQLEYVDLYLVHAPFGLQEKGDSIHPKDENGEILFDPSTDIIAIWKEMEKQKEAGLAKSIGLSNFNISQIERILSSSKIKPSNLQIELHLYFQQKEMRKFCQDKGISITAYSPLGSKGVASLLAKVGVNTTLPDILANPTVMEIAKKHNVSPAQVAIRYLIQINLIVIPKSTTPSRIKENINVFHFKLDETDMKQLEALDQGSKGRFNDFSFFKGVSKHPEFPFK